MRLKIETTWWDLKEVTGKRRKERGNKRIEVEKWEIKTITEFNDYEFS